LADPLPVLETAVAAIGQSVDKVALAHPPAGRIGARAEYVFAQVVRRNDLQVLDLTPECGHSMLATATHLRSRMPGVGPTHISLLTRRSGLCRYVDCHIGVVDVDAGVYRAGLVFPFDEDQRYFPLGKVPVEVVVDGLCVPAVVVDAGNPYAFVDADA